VFWRRKGCDILSSLYLMFSYVGIICAVDICRKQFFDTSVTRLGLWLQCGRKTTATPLCLSYSVTCVDKCKSWWLSSNRTTGLCFQGVACAAKCFTYVTKWSSAFYSDGPCVECVQFTLCSVTELVRKPLLPCCSVLPKYENESENPSPRSLFTFHGFAQLSLLVAVCQGVCCSSLTSSCKYALFSFLKWR
jgi:hypothetical protein